VQVLLLLFLFSLPAKLRYSSTTRRRLHDTITSLMIPSRLFGEPRCSRVLTELTAVLNQSRRNSESSTPME
jgi:hypothetical protein